MKITRLHRWTFAAPVAILSAALFLGATTAQAGPMINRAPLENLELPGTNPFDATGSTVEDRLFGGPALTPESYIWSLFDSSEILIGTRTSNSAIAPETDVSFALLGITTGGEYFLTLSVSANNGLITDNGPNGATPTGDVSNCVKIMLGDDQGAAAGPTSDCVANNGGGTTVPEPSTLGLFALAAAGFIGLRRRRG